MHIPIKDVLSKDQTVPHNHKQTLFIYNLEPTYMSGSHWVSTYAKDGIIHYFDSFGMAPFQKNDKPCKKRKHNIMTSNQSDTKHYDYDLWLFLLVFFK